MLIHVTNSQDSVNICPKEVQAIVACLLDYHQVSCHELSVHFVSIEDISRLHEEYFDDPSPTDCISFPIDDKEEDAVYKVLGDIFVCPEVALNYATAHLVSFEEELTLYIVHGLLHLLGYNDIDAEDVRQMRTAELRCIQLLQEQGLILQITSTAHA